MQLFNHMISLNHKAFYVQLKWFKRIVFKRFRIFQIPNFIYISHNILFLPIVTFKEFFKSAVILKANGRVKIDA